MFRFRVLRAQREGTPIPRWKLASLPRCEGTLSLKEERDQALGRTVRVARLRDDRTVEVFPPLIEPVVLQVDNRMVLSGMERDALSERVSAQTWVLEGEFSFWGYAAQSEGRAIPRWQMSSGIAWRRGALAVHEERDELLRRTVRIARLMGDGPTSLLGTLIEPVIARVDERFILCGMERNGRTHRMTSQEWVMQART